MKIIMRLSDVQFEDKAQVACVIIITLTHIYVVLISLQRLVCKHVLELNHYSQGSTELEEVAGCFHGEIAGLPLSVSCQQSVQPDHRAMRSTGSF